MTIHRKNSNTHQLTPRPCPYCDRHMDEVFLKAKHEKMMVKKRAALAEAFRERRLAGEPIGRQGANR